MKEMGISFVRWDITSNCNLSCKHCYASDLYRRSSKDLSLGEIHKIIRNLSNPGVHSIAFYGGEPLLRKDISRIINYCTLHGINSYIVTNGILLEDHLDSLCQSGLSGVAISIDGATPETYEYIRGKPFFEKIKKSLEILQKSRIEAKAINVVLMRENMHEAKEFLKLAADFSMTRLNFDILASVGHARHSSYVSPLSPREFIQTSELLIESALENDLSPNIVNLEIAPPILLEYLNSKYKCNLPIERKIPRVTIDHLFVDPTGLAYPCKGTHAGLAIKNFCSEGIDLLNHTLADVLKSKRFGKLFALLNPSEIASNLPHCKSCRFFMEECYPCPISAIYSEKEFAQSCMNYPIGKICSILRDKSF